MVSIILRRLGSFLHRRSHVVHFISHLPTFVTMPRSDWIIIGISGVTCGGKTTLANRLKDAIAPVYLFHQDMYFYPDDSPKHVKCKGLPHNNYDILSSLDMERMYSDVMKTMEGDDKSNASSLEKIGKFTLNGKLFMIIEGFTVLNYKPLLELCDFRYYFILDYAECVTRRCFRLYDPPDIDGYFDQCVWPEHLKYRAEIEKDKRVKRLDGTRPDVFELVMSELKALSM